MLLVVYGNRTRTASPWHYTPYPPSRDPSVVSPGYRGRAVPGALRVGWVPVSWVRGILRPDGETPWCPLVPPPGESGHRDPGEIPGGLRTGPYQGGLSLDIHTLP